MDCKCNVTPWIYRDGCWMYSCCSTYTCQVNKINEEKDNTRMVSMTLDEYNNYLIWKTQQEINRICNEVQ